MYWTIRIIGLNIIIFLLELLFGDFFIDLFAITPAELFQEPWTLITSMFLHANFFHLFFNMVALFFFGSYFESEYGYKHFLRLYFLSGILGNIAYYLYDPTSNIPGVGASGAIYGVMGALALLKPFMIVYINFIPVPMIFAAGLWLLYNLVGLFFPYSNIGYQAHLAGMFVGFAYAYWLKKQHKTFDNYYYTFEDYP